MTDAPQLSPNARAVAQELAWLAAVIEARLTHFFKAPEQPFSRAPAPVPIPGTALGDLIETGPLEDAARLVLALALAPHVQPAILDPFFVRNAAIDRIFSEFGGIRGDTGGFHPTMDTALFLIAGDATPARIAAMGLFQSDHPLRARAGILLTSATPGAATQANLLQVPAHRAIGLCEGHVPRPDFSSDFPARLLTTKHDWSDLVLPQQTLHRVEHIVAWLENERRILHDWGLERNIGAGFRALFFGPPGTGKTLTAALLGKRTGLDVYRIDLSMIVSKYIGETEKNLAAVFDLAAERRWILFFDEADAIFGARTSVTSSNDRHANQEVAYLLQRIEECPSLVILATNLRGNIDDAFFRRFQAAIHFAKPDAAQREQLWRSLLNPSLPITTDVDPAHLAREHALVGGAMNNVLRHAAITALRRGAEAISLADLNDAIANELQKEGRTP